MTMAQHDPSYTDHHLSRQAPSALTSFMRGLRLLVGLEESDTRPRMRHSSLSDRLFAEDLERSADPYARQVARSFDLLDPVDCADVRCRLVDHEAGDLAAHAYWLHQRMRLRVLGEPCAQALQAPGSASERELLLVNIDVYRSLDDAVPALVSLRRQFPKLAVVIASTRFHRHDFGSDRAALADASVRLPASRATIEIAISHALSAAGKRRLIL